MTPLFFEKTITVGAEREVPHCGHPKYRLTKIEGKWKGAGHPPTFQLIISAKLEVEMAGNGVVVPKKALYLYDTEQIWATSHCKTPFDVVLKLEPV